MAIQNQETKEYYKIDKDKIDLDNNSIILLEYKNKAHRTSGDTKWLTHLEHKIQLPDFAGEIDRINFTTLGETNYKNILTKVAYLQLKTVEPYIWFEDC